MQTTIEFLDAIRAAHGLTSDYQLAKHLKIRPSRISNYRLGVSLFDEETCLLVASELDLEPAYVAACIQAERAKAPAVKAMWKHAAEVLYGVAAVLVIVAALPAPLLEGYGVNTAWEGLPMGGSVYYVKPFLQFWILLVPLALLAMYRLPGQSGRSS